MEDDLKQLLLKDLSARLPYGVIVRHADYLIDSDGNYTGQFWYKRGYLCNICSIDNMTTTIIESEGSDEEGYEHICDLERSLPYLRPMSSMTEEEKRHCFMLEHEGNIEHPNGIFYRSQDYLNSIHVAYRTIGGKDMFELNLALKAPEGMYNIKQE